MFGTNLTGKSKAELAHICNEDIKSHFNKVIILVVYFGFMAIVVMENVWIFNYCLTTCFEDVLESK